MCVCAPNLLHPLICQWIFRLFPCLGTGKWTVVDTAVHVLFQTIVLQIYAQGGISGSSSISILNF